MQFGARENGAFAKANQHHYDRRLCIFSGTFMLCIAGAPLAFLRLIQVQEELIPLASQYLRIVFAGLVFTFIYNFYANTLRALGDSTTPVYFLVIASVLNVFWRFVLCAWSFIWAARRLCSGNRYQPGLARSVLRAVYQEESKILCLGKDWLFFDKSQFAETIRAAGARHAAGVSTAWENWHTGHCQHHGVSVVAAAASESELMISLLYHSRALLRP